MTLQMRLCLNSMGQEVPDQELRLYSNRISKMKDSEKCMDSELWHACAGSMVKVPAVNSIVYYFPQGHAEHAQYLLDNLPYHVFCRVVSLKLMADPETDEVYVKILLIPVNQNLKNINDTPDGVTKTPESFAKTLTQSDANNGGGFSVPRQCAITMFPMLNYQEDPPVQYISCIDVHGEKWNFRLIYRGSPKRHLLTTGWSTFVNQKKLVAGDSIVFLKKQSGEIHIGIRRMKPSYKSTKFHGSNNCNFSRIRSAMKDSVMEAVKNALNGQMFEVVYYPRGGTPEYVVKEETVRVATTMIHWCPGMRFKMAVESDDQSRISWFMGIVTGVERRMSLWRQLEVRWVEAGGVLEGVKRVNPWLVEPVSSMYMPPPCLQLPPAYGHQFHMPLQQQQQPQQLQYSGIQGFRHNAYESKFTAPAAPNKREASFCFKDGDVGVDDIACELTIKVGQASTAKMSSDAKKKSTSAPTTTFMLFGKTIVTNAEEERIADESSSGNDRSSRNANHGSSSSGGNVTDDDALPQMINFI